MKEKASYVGQMRKWIETAKNVGCTVPSQWVVNKKQLDALNGLIIKFEVEFTQLQKGAEKWQEFREAFKEHKCKYGTICCEKIDAETLAKRVKEGV